MLFVLMCLFNTMFGIVSLLFYDSTKKSLEAFSNNYKLINALISRFTLIQKGPSSPPLLHAMALSIEF